jgi:hypothetical protein
MHYGREHGVLKCVKVLALLGPHVLPVLSETACDPTKEAMLDM